MSDHANVVCLWFLLGFTLGGGLALLIGAVS